MAQRLLLLGVVGSGLALNAFGISYFNTSEMSSMFDTGTGNAERDSSAEADTGGRPGFDAKAMVKHFLKAGNRFLVPMEVQMNHRLHHILRRIMSDNPEIEELEAEIKDLEEKKTFLEDEAKAMDDAEEQVKALDKIAELEAQIEDLKFQKADKEAEAENKKALEREKELLKELEAEKNKVIGRIIETKKNGPSPHLKKLFEHREGVNNKLKVENAKKAVLEKQTKALKSKLEVTKPVTKPKTNLKITTPTEQKMKLKPAVPKLKAKTTEFKSNLKAITDCSEPLVQLTNDEAGEALAIVQQIKILDSTTETKAKKITAKKELMALVEKGTFWNLNKGCSKDKAKRDLVAFLHCRFAKSADITAATKFKQVFPACFSK